MNNYIIDIDFNNQLVSDKKILEIENIINNEQITNLLNYIIYNTNKILSDDREDPYINKCDLSQAIIGQVLNKLGIKVFVLETQKAIDKNVKGHSFLVVKFNNNDLYLVDNTYRQFFLIDDCLENKKLIINNKIVLSPNPGFYISQNNNRLKTILPLLENGFIKLSEEVAKIYCDSFLATRTNIYDFEKMPNISGLVYINSFLNNTSNYSKEYYNLNKRVIMPSEKLEILKNLKEQLGNNADYNKIKYSYYHNIL